MSVPDPRIVVIGGTRGTGLLVVQRLLQDGCRVRVLARNPASAKASLPDPTELVEGDITRPETLPPAVREIDHLIFTAGLTQRWASELVVRETTYDGVRNTLAACKDAGFHGRFLYMTTVGVTRSSPAAVLLNLMKRRLLKWRILAEEEVRRSGLAYTVVRSGILTHAPPGQRAALITQDACPLALRHRVSRGDAAEALVQALAHPETDRTTFNLLGAGGSSREPWESLFGRLIPDP